MWSYRDKLITLNAVTSCTKDCQTFVSNFYITLHMCSKSQFGVSVCGNVVYTLSICNSMVRMLQAGFVFELDQYILMTFFKLKFTLI